MKRLSAEKVLRFSVNAAVLCLVIALGVFAVTRSWWTLLPLALAVWFAFDAKRARGWLAQDDPDSPPSQ